MFDSSNIAKAVGWANAASIIGGAAFDIALAAAFFVSCDAAWIAGTILNVDGGRDAAGLDLSSLK